MEESEHLLSLDGIRNADKLKGPARSRKTERGTNDRKFVAAPDREGFPRCGNVNLQSLSAGWKMEHKKVWPPPHYPLSHGRSGAACRALCLALLLVATGGAQTRPTSPSLPTLPSGRPVGSIDDYDIPKNDPTEEQRRLRALNAERQKRVAKDASKILKLSNELSAEIARANPESLTPAQLRMVAEIEKLARDLKANMTSATLPSTGFQNPMDPSQR